MTIRRGLALGCGGLVGYAWSVCALRRFEESTGWDAREAEVLIGTSAGSLLAALLGSGKSARDLADAQRRAATSGKRRTPAHLPPAPRGLPLSPRLFFEGVVRGEPILAACGLMPAGRADASAFVTALEKLVEPGAWVPHPKCWTVAMDVGTGDRMAFGREGAPRTSIHEAVAASCAIPGWISPVTIEGRRYLDGGTISSVSVDLLAEEGLDEIVVISPMTSSRFAPPRSVADAAERVMRTIMSRRLDKEIARVEAAGTKVIRIEPTARDLALMGPNFMDARRVANVIDVWS